MVPYCSWVKSGCCDLSLHCYCRWDPVRSADGQRCPTRLNLRPSAVYSRHNVHFPPSFMLLAQPLSRLQSTNFQTFIHLKLVLRFKKQKTNVCISQGHGSDVPTLIQALNRNLMDKVQHCKYLIRLQIIQKLLCLGKKIKLNIDVALLAYLYRKREFLL